ncbi:hypothetical protein LSH36_970g00086 [Paralvinella palmiformis]|uniref:Methyltransferase FkbM domain-containing protein n=1 Tax=Paralvinella palmiformis TaxID=53620 RepID=A0AAD9IYB9_9ANNE|nr:hypothetical protein LSH36_970g00086 [Paralvinella palmiformis]
MCHVKTLGSLRKQFQKEEKMIDYLKMDVEGSEWPSLEAMFKEGFLTKYVKQIGIENHSYLFRKSPKRFLTILAKLEELGFRKWNVHWNMHCLRKKKNTLSITLCTEVYYINMNILK